MLQKERYTPAKVQKGAKHKGQTIPDQSMSIQEIVKRFVRGIPVDIIQRQRTYVDQSEHDLEKLSRMDFAEKAEMAEQMQARAQEIAAEHNANERAKREKQQKQSEDRKQAKGAQKTDIDPLDNTMSDDTKQ